MRKSQTVRRWETGVAAAVACALAGCGWFGAAVASAAPIAHAARTVSVVDTARLHLVHKSGSVLDERGSASGSIPGTVTAHFKVAVVFITGSVTFHPRGGGSFTIRVVGVPKSAGLNSRFAGSISVTGGTGRYAHARGSGSFSGVVNRRSWAATVTARGRLSY